MNTKRVYFVRHGQSVSNVNQTVQGLEDTLTDEGRRQANKLAERVHQLEFDVFLSSDAVRAVETAQAISQATGREFKKKSLFREVRRPTSFIGKHRCIDEYQAYLKAEEENISDPKWQFEDGEHFFAARDRALEAIEYLENYNADNILVVTHGYFTRYMVATILLEKQLTPKAWVSMKKTMVEINTGITMCIHDEERWKLITWNDIAHFAE